MPELFLELFSEEIPARMQRGAAVELERAVTAALGAGLPCSGGERRMLGLTASLAAGTPVDLRDAVTGLDGRSARLAAGAVLHAGGHRDEP